MKVWREDEFAERYINRIFIVICEGKAYKLTSNDGFHTNVFEIKCLESNIEETDSRIILYCLFSSKEGYNSIKICSPDSDIFFIILTHIKCIESKVFFETGTGNNKKLINMTELASDFTSDYCMALTSLHAFTHCDTTSAFRGIGKIKPLKILQKNPKYQNLLSRLGEDWSVPGGLSNNQVKFVCDIYKKPRFINI